MNRRSFLSMLPFAPVVFLRDAIQPQPAHSDYQPIGYVDARLSYAHCEYKIIDKKTGEDLTEKESIVWADDRAGVYGRMKKGHLGNEDVDIETVKREIMLISRRDWVNNYGRK